MPTSFGETIPSNFKKIHPRHTAGLPFHQDQVELDSLLPFDAQSLQTEIRSDHPFESREQPQQENTESPLKYRSSPILASTPEEPSDSHFSAPSSDSLDNEEPQMGRKHAKAQPQEGERPTSTALGSPNGSINGSMDSRLEMRRKHPVLESPGADTQAAHLMGREGFSLDDEVPPTPMTPNPNASFFDLPRQDRRNFLLLVLLYFLQGIPMGLASGSVPFLLKPYLSYGQIGVFSLASYPYSLKLLWSPIVDAVWSPALGRRKSWILPIQMCSGFGMLYLGSRIKEMMVTAGKSDGSGVWNFTGWWFFLVFLCATQDIAVDGWYCCNSDDSVCVNIVSRVGADSAVAAKSFIRLDSPNSRAHRWPFPLVHGIPCFKCT